MPFVLLLALGLAPLASCVQRGAPVARGRPLRLAQEPPAPQYLALETCPRFYSQVSQDYLVASLHKCMAGGYFVDLASNDAFRLSNSAMLEQAFNWSGICIEANPGYAAGYGQRKCQLHQRVVGSPTGTEVSFEMRGVMGGIVGDDFDNKEKSAQAKEPKTFTTISLGDLLDSAKAPSTIQYFSLDVEGAESMVMKDFPWGKYTFMVITVERPKPDLLQALEENGYVQLRVNSNFGDLTFIHRSFPDFTSVLATWKNGAPQPRSCLPCPYPFTRSGLNLGVSRGEKCVGLCT